MFFLGHHMYLGDVAVLFRTFVDSANFLRMDQTSRFITYLLNYFFRVTSAFFCITRVCVTIASRTHSDQQSRIITTTREFRRVRYFFVITRLRVTSANVDLYRIANQYTSMLISSDFRSFVVHAISIRYRIREIFYGVLFTFRRDYYNFFLLQGRVSILSARGDSGGRDRYCGAVGSFL